MKEEKWFIVTQIQKVMWSKPVKAKSIRNAEKIAQDFPMKMSEVDQIDSTMWRFQRKITDVEEIKDLESEYKNQTKYGD